jgi:hypothetical protein
LFWIKAVRRSAMLFLVVTAVALSARDVTVSGGRGEKGSGLRTLV